MTTIIIVMIGEMTITDQIHMIVEGLVAITAANPSPEDPEVDVQDWLAKHKFSMFRMAACQLQLCLPLGAIARNSRPDVVEFVLGKPALTGTAGPAEFNMPPDDQKIDCSGDYPSKKFALELMNKEHACQ